MDADEEIRSALATLATPATSDDFWDHLHTLLVNEAARTSTAASPDEVFNVVALPRRDRRTVRLVVVAAAVVALVVGGLVWIGGRHRVEPANPGPDAPTTTQAVAPRDNAVITDAAKIDVDSWLTGAPAWPPPTGPYHVFDVDKLPDGWTLDTVGGGASVPAPWLGVWGWGAFLLSPTGVRYGLSVAPANSPTAGLVDDGQPISVRGHDGAATDTVLSWQETDTVIARIASFDEGDHRDEEIELAESLVAIDVAELPGSALTDVGVQRPDASLIQLQGTISGRGWWVKVKTAPPLDISMSVDGWGSGGGYSRADVTSSTITSLGLSVNGVPGGVIVYGFAPSSVDLVRLELSDQVTIDMPIYGWTGGTAFAVPIPDGLDVAAIVYLDAAGAVLHRTLLPPFAIPTTGGLGGDSSFGVPAGTTISGMHAPYSTAPPTPTPNTAPDGQSPPATTSADTVSIGTSPPPPADADLLRGRPIVLPTLAAGEACPVTTTFVSLSKDLGPMAGTGAARPVGLNAGEPLALTPNAATATTPFGAKIVWALPIDTEGPVLVRGRQLDGDGTIQFSDGTSEPADDLVLTSAAAVTVTKNGAPTKNLDGGWYSIPATTTFTTGGCYGFQIDSAAGASTVVFEATTTTVDQASATATDPTPPTTASEFCLQYTKSNSNNPESYVGSDAHRQDIAALAAVAPDAIRPQLQTFIEFLDSGYITPDNPDTNLTENWPDPVQQAVTAITCYATTNC